MKIEIRSRKICLDILSAVLRKSAGLEEEFSKIIDIESEKQEIENRDRTFIRLLLTTSLRRLGEIDYYITRLLSKPLPAKASFVQDVIRISIAQILYLKTPEHAAVSTAVELVKNSLFKGFSGLVNAVLHRFIKEQSKICAVENVEAKNIPSWLYNIWKQEYGSDKTRKIVSACLKEASLDFSVKNNPEYWAQKLDCKVLPTGTLRREKSCLVSSLPGYEDGEWWIQDFSAALPVKLFQSISGKKVADICAAPGGKTAQLILAGANVEAVDISKSRIKRLEENLSRLNFSIKTSIQDALEWALCREKESFDAILLDAPCSATGTIRRHPDVLFHRKYEDIERLNELQYELLKSMLPLLKKNGILVYCVCSIIPDEGGHLIDRIVQDHLAERICLTNEVPFEFISKKGDLLVTPDCYQEYGGCDGFFAARLKKVEANV